MRKTNTFFRPFLTLALMRSCRMLALIVAVLLSSSSMAQDKNAKVTLNVNNLEELMDQVEAQTSFTFLLNTREIDVRQSISMRCREELLGKALDRAFKGSGITYSFLRNQIVLSKNRQIRRNRQSLDAGKPQIRGTVKDAQGNAIIGATVTEKGTGNRTITDADGNFTINADKGDVISISYIGFHELETKASDNMHLTMIEDHQSLDEVVVVAYGTQKKINLTGSVSMVNGDDLQMRPVSTVSSGLQGIIPGLTVTDPSGQPGATPGIRIRGVSTINSSTSPLILIDGVAGGDLNLLNPQDIESISVLKDAASSAVYGARAANGVVLITTKKGNKNEVPSITYHGYLGVQTPDRLPKLVNGREFMELSNEAQVNAGYSPLYTKKAFEMYDKGTSPNEYSNTDWIGLIFKKNAIQQNHSVSVRGGSSKTAFFLSYGYMSQDGLVVGDAFKAKRHNARLSVNTEISNRLKISGEMSFVDNFRSSAGVSGVGGVFRLAQRISPLLPVYWKTQDDKGNWVDTDKWSKGSVRNPLCIAYEGGKDLGKSRTLNTIANANFKILEGLTLDGQYSANYYFQEIDAFTPKILDYMSDGSEAKSNVNARNRVSQSHKDALTQSLQFTLNFAKQSGLHELSALAGFSQEWYDYSDLAGSRASIILDDIYVLSAGTEDITNSGTKKSWALRSYFGRVNYAFNSKYLLEANFRIDGTSRFSKENRWGFFPSFSAGWNFAREGFMKFAEDVMSNGKLRVSWGELGNQNVGSDFYPYLTPIDQISKSYPIGGVNNVGFAKMSLGNRNIKWETLRMFNVGLDLGFFRQRLSITFDWFQKDNINALVKPIYPTIVGIEKSENLPFENMGKIRNKGWELEARWKDHAGDFSYDVAFNVYDVRNKIIDLGKSKPTLGNLLRREGDPLNAYFGYLTDGLAQISDFQGQDDNGKYIVPKFATPLAASDIVQPGDIKYRDVSGPEGIPDGIIDDHDKVVLADPLPHYCYSLKLGAAWKGIDLNIFFQGVGQAKGYLSNEARHAFINDYSVPKVEHLDRWTPANPNATYPRLYQGQSHNLLFSSYWMEDASYLRLKTVRLGYTFPKQLLFIKGIQKVRIYATADNLLTFTNYFGSFDPEVRSTSGGVYPQVKTFVFGLSLTF